MKALGDVRDIVIAAVVGLVGWLIYKAVKGSAPVGPRNEPITTSDGTNIDVVGKISAPADRGQVEYGILYRTYRAAATVTNRGNNQVNVQVMFESYEKNNLTGLQSSGASSPQPVTLKPGESRLVESDMPVASSAMATTFSPVTARLYLMLVAGEMKSAISSPVTFDIV